MESKEKVFFFLKILNINLFFRVSYLATKDICFVYFKLKELDDTVSDQIAILQLRFEHNQANGLPSRCLYRKIQTLKREEITIQSSRVDVLSYLLDYYRS